MIATRDCPIHAVTICVGQIFFWSLKAEMHVADVHNRFGILLEQYLRNCGDHRTALGTLTIHTAYCSISWFVLYWMANFLSTRIGGAPSGHQVFVLQKLDEVALRLAKSHDNKSDRLKLVRDGKSACIPLVPIAMFWSLLYFISSRSLRHYIPFQIQAPSGNATDTAFAH
jgi:hypothetical protein